jgi:hypothetical protein
MARIEKIERLGTVFRSYEIKLSCGHTIKVDRQPKVYVDDDYKCPVC